MHHFWFSNGHQTVLIIFILGCFVNCNSSERCDRKHVTVAEMKAIVVGRCYDYQRTVHPDYFCQSGLKNCTELWEKFSAAFMDKSECNVTADLYTDFIEAATHAFTGKQLFYSGLYGFAQRYSLAGERYFTLEDTLIGYMIDGLSFCMANASNSTDQCDARTSVTCPHTARSSFWGMASINFARNANGHVYVLLNASRDPIVKDTSYFITYEVPSLQGNRVTQLTAILLNSHPISDRDPCKHDEAMQSLRTLVEKKNIVFDCRENPSDLSYLYCSDAPRSELCQDVNINTSSSSTIAAGHLICIYLVTTVAMIAQGI